MFGAYQNMCFGDINIDSFVALTIPEVIAEGVSKK